MSEKHGIDDYRENIDSINLEILKLLNKRAKIVQKVAELKQKAGSEFFDPVRQSEMLQNIFNENKGPLSNELLKSVFDSVFSMYLDFMNISKQSSFLVNRGSDRNFRKINEMFNISCAVIHPFIFAGPCAVENEEYLTQVAEFLCQNDVKFLRAGAYKPRTSPYEFQGLGILGLKMLKKVASKYELCTITEVVDTRDVEIVAQYVGILQIGARNMCNFELLKEVGRAMKPVIIKRGMGSTLEEFISAAEYLAKEGNDKIIMCERGIRTFETKTRNTLDMSAVPILKLETKLPVIVDVSHSLGRKDIVGAVTKSAIAAGADGVMVEVHPCPELALSDSRQQLNLDEFGHLLKVIRT